MKVRSTAAVRSYLSLLGLSALPLLSMHASASGAYREVAYESEDKKARQLRFQIYNKDEAVQQVKVGDQVVSAGPAWRDQDYGPTDVGRALCLCRDRR